MGLRGVISAGDGTVMAPSIWGKLKANVQFLAILLAIWWPAVEVGGVAIAELALWIAAAVTVASAVEYFARFRGVLTQRGAPGPGAQAP